MIQILFWPCMLVSLFLAVLAICLQKPKYLVISSLLILPLSVYLAATPRFYIWGLTFPFFYVGAAISTKKNLRWLSSLLVAPNFFLIGWLGITVLRQ
ncbi:hypothetical protein [Neobacillus thermocopriae]|uniref:Uncharacterized protein n=1 Tax=Neobacillus thermocopriae TaxID=1215031 RepID=A0A6B3TNM3_9BACI|nr:hypothetical protein [Neobacillus thermocopriae]MED3624689.1 hypothetical protein [Neobacillus thermocopriae]MED3713161.1 hypothetical protein [Neobacillus thermocopriae]NEX78463.1 hypothetical protein [Neobacillus thermocopriae]